MLWHGSISQGESPRIFERRFLVFGLLSLLPSLAVAFFAATGCWLDSLQSEMLFAGFCME
jgi:hypothetical protein